jgi:hypothetical protein
MLLNDYLICFRFTRGSAIKRTVQVGRSVLGRVHSGGVSPRTIQLGGATLEGKIPFPLMKNGERFIICRVQIHGSRGRDGQMKSMSDMNLVLHQSVAINAKGGYCLLIGLVVIDVNP